MYCWSKCHHPLHSDGFCPFSSALIKGSLATAVFTIAIFTQVEFQKKIDIFGYVLKSVPVKESVWIT